MRALPFAATALLLLATLAASAPPAAADVCPGVTIDGEFTGVCVVTEGCATSTSGIGVQVVRRGEPGRCIGVL